MAEISKEHFCFQIIKPGYSFLFSILTDGLLNVSETISGNKQQTEKQLSKSECELFFSDLEKLGFYSWPPNLDCCACDDSSWEIMVDYEGKKKKCFGVFGFEPDTWPELLSLVERSINIKLPLKSYGL